MIIENGEIVGNEMAVGIYVGIYIVSEELF